MWFHLFVMHWRRQANLLQPEDVCTCQNQNYVQNWFLVKPWPQFIARNCCCGQLSCGYVYNLHQYVFWMSSSHKYCCCFLLSMSSVSHTAGNQWSDGHYKVTTIHKECREFVHSQRLFQACRSGILWTIFPIYFTKYWIIKLQESSFEF